MPRPTNAVQEAWLRLSRCDTSGVDNLGGWLTTVVARVCWTCCARTARREESLGGRLPEPIMGREEEGTDPEHEALLAVLAD